MSASAAVLAVPIRAGAWTAAGPMKGLHVLINAPAYLFLLALAAMLFRPSELQTFPVDRIAFLLLVAICSLRLLLRRGRIAFYSASWPMLLLLVLSLRVVLAQPYNTVTWSVLAAQWVVPVVLFHLAGSVFADDEQQRKLQRFSSGVLLYLSLIAVFWLLNLNSLIYPRFILDDSLGIHADRARGPFLQAVANGVSINVLAIVVLHAYDRGSASPTCCAQRVRKALIGLLFVTTPLALLATKTRAVWLGACLSAVLIILFARERRSRYLVTVLTLSVTVIAVCFLLLRIRTGELKTRLEDRAPVEFRLEMYRAGWQMFIEKPLLGWSTEANIQAEIEKRVSSFHPRYYIVHNTYLHLAIQHGLLGLLLYAWVFIAFFRLGATREGDAAVFGGGFGLMWRVMLCVYLLNATVVVMNYQFVNGYMFTLAGILAARQTRVRDVELVWRPA